MFVGLSNSARVFWSFQLSCGGNSWCNLLNLGPWPCSHELCFSEGTYLFGLTLQVALLAFSLGSSASGTSLDLPLQSGSSTHLFSYLFGDNDPRDYYDSSSNSSFSTNYITWISSGYSFDL